MLISSSSNLPWQNSVELTARFVLGPELSSTDCSFFGSGAFLYLKAPGDTSPPVYAVQESERAEAPVRSRLLSVVSGYEQRWGHSAPKGGPPCKPLYDTRSDRAPHGIAVFARPHNAWMFIKFKSNFRFEGQPCAFKDDFRVEFVSHQEEDT
jgi:hypothetical protein